MDHNAVPHRARLVRSYLESETIPQMAWIARSQDPNTIGHVRDMLGRQIAGRTFHELQQALLQEWALLPHKEINDTIASIPRSCQACISVSMHSTSSSQACIQLISVITVWFPLHILPPNLCCRAATAVIYVFLIVFALLFDMWSTYLVYNFHAYPLNIFVLYRVFPFLLIF
ncbi:hypothetical protein AVEN_83851-1 [Araneus ventricosus]|uniref:Tc1-like transposase DDE domain-containing protein n=1 Tax=Araneus ventricosus TaxID=182803 RepID=A0A4Y2S162_ARAVE|nr:hypothetical protein AVEN_29513-1 [Araneus ventricosus]GBN81326.1 hypothetical protein AVEN_83851-1 [Araneus ventricosus]